MSVYQCPCCNSYTLPVPADCAIAFICPVCLWENDVFIHGDDEPSDENGGMTLREAQSNFRKFGAFHIDFLKQVRPATEEEKTGVQKD